MASPTVAANAYATSPACWIPARAGKASAATPAARRSAPCSRTRSAACVDGGRKSDAQTVAMAAGKANVMDVVTAVAETDVEVSTLVSVRDKVIPAYEDIMKMPI